MSLWGTTARLTALVIVVFLGWFGIRDALTTTGNEAAGDHAASIADRLREIWTAPAAYAPVPAENFAAGESIKQLARSDQTVDLTALAWQGTSADEHGATVDVRVHVDEPAHSDGAVFGTSYQAGSATQCYRFTIHGNRNYEQVEHDRIDCPRVLTSTPPVSRQVTIPDNAKRLLTDTLRSTSVAAMDSDVKAAFPQKHLFTRTAEDGGRLIASVGVVGGGECVVAVLRREGTVSFPEFPREWLQPGEIGCSPDLVTRPPS